MNWSAGRTHSALGTRHSAWAISSRAVLQIVLLAGIFVLSFFNSTDPDLWWHLATGRFIVDTGAIPTSDPFSYTAMGEWIIPEWIGEVAIYLLYAWGGYVTAVAVFAALIALSFWFVLVTARELGLGVAATCMVTTWAAAISWPFWMVRPQILSFFFFALYLYLLIRSRRRLDRWLWLLPPAMVIWVNFHSAYVMGLMILGLFLLGEAVNRILLSIAGGPPLRTALASVRAAVASLVKSYAPLVVGTLVAAMVNPEGPRMLLYPLSYTSNRDFNLKYVAEWHSPDFHETYFLVFAASILLLMVLGTRRRVDWALAIPIVAVTLMSLMWQRTMPFYAIVFAPYLASRLVARRPSDEATPPRSSPRVSGTRWNWALLLVCLLAMMSTLFVTERAQIGKEPSLAGFPSEGLKYIKQEGLTGRLFNTYHWGGFILWKSYPDRSVFIDGRSDMYGAAIVADYKEIHSIGPRWRGVLDRYGVDVMLIEKDSALRNLLLVTGEWDERFRGEIETVLVKRVPTNGR